MAQSSKTTRNSATFESSLQGSTQPFQPELFMKKYRKRFLDCLKPLFIADFLRAYNVIPEDLYLKMEGKKISEKDASAKLYLHLCSHGNPEMIHDLCYIMADWTMYPLMKKLGEDMKRDSDLPPYTDLPPSSDRPPSSDLPPSSCPPQSRTLATSTTAEPTPSLSTSDDERTQKLKQAYEGLKQFYTRHDVTGVKCRYSRNIEFINLATVERSYYRAKPKKDVTEFLQAVIHGVDGYYENSASIEYENILTCFGNTSGKRVVISGPPGCGKTTLARKLCRDLYSGGLPHQYQLVVFVELRQLRLHMDKRRDDIDLHFLLHHLDLPELCPVIEEQAGTGVILILDGFDEVADWLGKSPFLSKLLSCTNRYFSQCDMFVTTRPSRYIDLMSIIETSPFHVEILGFTSSNINSYIQSYFRSDADKSLKVIHRLDTLPLVRGICRIPRVLEIVCMVQKYLNDDPLPENLSGIFLKYICHQLEEFLSQTRPSVKKRIQNLLEVPEDLFPGFYQLCEVAYKCCLHQRLILTDKDLGDLKNYVDDRGSVYNVLFSEDIDDHSPIAGVLYQFDHKTVQEALGAAHIGHQSKAEQEKIWSEWFNTPHMAEVWKMYCGLTGLEYVDLASLSFSSLSERAREVMDQHLLQDGNMLVMISLYEANNRSVSEKVLQAVFKNTIRAHLEFHYHSQVVAYAIEHHPTVERVSLTFSRSFLSGSDLKPLNESIRKLKAIELCGDYPPVETVLSALSGQVEELRLTAQFEVIVLAGLEAYWKRVGDALEASHSLRSLHIDLAGFSMRHELSAVLTGLCRKNRLTELAFSTGHGVGGFSVDLLKNVIVHQEKCTIRAPLTCQQWCVALSALKDAKKLKEFCVQMKYTWGDHTRGIVIDSFNVVEELVATSDQLVKVDVGCDEQIFLDLVLSVVKGTFRNRNISELGISFHGHDQYILDSSRSVLVQVLKDLAHTDHITCLRFEISLLSITAVLGDKWCDLLVTGPMSRPVCHLGLNLSPDQCGLLLSRVHKAEQLEELSLAVIESRKRDDTPVDVQAVEGALSNCRLRKLRIGVEGEGSLQWYDLCGAVLRGIAANHNKVELVLHYNRNHYPNKHLMSQLAHQVLENFEVVERKMEIYFISKPHTPTASKKMSPPLSPSREDQPYPISQPSSPVVTAAPKSPEHTESISPSSLSTGRDLTSHPLQEVTCLQQTPVCGSHLSTAVTCLQQSPVYSRQLSTANTCLQQPHVYNRHLSTAVTSSQEQPSVEGVIKGTSSFLPYMDKMLSYLLVLGTALEVEEYTAAVVDAPGAPETKCIKILKRWLDSTPNPTWRVFCEKLKKAKGLNRVRTIIQAKEL